MSEKIHTHEEALRAIIGCAQTVTVLSYEETIGAYLSLRGFKPDGSDLAALEPCHD